MSRVSTGTRTNTNQQRAPNGASGPRPRPSKRLILCEDGTWLNSDAGSLRGALAIPSNITRISRAIKPMSSDGIPQIVYYHFGVGAGGGVVDRIYGGVSGDGMYCKPSVQSLGQLHRI